MARKRKRAKKIKIVERKLGREKCYGQCWQNDNKIEVDERLEKRKKLLIYCHELTHLGAGDWLSETQVEKISQVICKGLWQANFRQVDN